MGMMESIWGCWMRVKQSVCGKQDRVRLTQMVCATALHVPDWDVCLPVYMEAES